MEEQNREECEIVPLLMPYKRKTEKIKQAETYLKNAMRNLKEKMYSYIYALNNFEFVAIKNFMNLCTDGIHIYYNPDYIVDIYQSNKTKYIEIEIAHIMVHGLLGHFEEESNFRHTKLVWVIMDAQVQKVLMNIGIIHYNWNKSTTNAYKSLEDISFYGYAPYYAALMKKSLRRNWLSLSDQYMIDDHRYWRNQKSFDMLKQMDNSHSNEIRDISEEIQNKWKQIRKVVFGENVSLQSVENRMCSMKQDRKGEFGEESGEEHMSVQPASEGKSYKEILEKFLSEKESCKEDIDNLDRMLYNYGLDIYGDVPLIEPAEISDVRQLNSLVIAIDTSGSCSGLIAGQFLKETYNILQDIKDSICFENIYLIQCDCKIQKEQCFDSVDELIDNNISYLCGFGGTSFVPVFDRISQLENLENMQIDALIYFTDGDGEYPLKQPDYPVIFAMPVDEFSEDELFFSDEIPDWIQCVNVTVGDRSRGW